MFTRHAKSVNLNYLQRYIINFVHTYIQVRLRYISIHIYSFVRASKLNLKFLQQKRITDFHILRQRAQNFSVEDNISSNFQRENSALAIQFLSVIHCNQYHPKAHGPDGIIHTLQIIFQRYCTIHPNLHVSTIIIWISQKKSSTTTRQHFSNNS